MTKLIAIEAITLDGVMQAPGLPDEDTRGGFARGGWAAPYTDEVGMRVAGERMAASGGGAMLLGRVTYERLRQSWAGRDDNPFSPVLDRRRKYVVSTTLAEPLPWQNSILLVGDAVASVGELKASGTERELGLLGSGALLRALLAAELVAEPEHDLWTRIERLAPRTWTRRLGSVVRRKAERCEPGCQATRAPSESARDRISLAPGITERNRAMTAAATVRIPRKRLGRCSS